MCYFRACVTTHPCTFQLVLMWLQWRGCLLRNGMARFIYIALYHSYRLQGLQCSTFEWDIDCSPQHRYEQGNTFQSPHGTEKSWQGTPAACPLLGVQYLLGGKSERRCQEKQYNSQCSVEMHFKKVYFSYFFKSFWQQGLMHSSRVLEIVGEKKTVKVLKKCDKNSILCSCASVTVWHGTHVVQIFTLL